MYKITEDCRFCNTCITVCPVEAIEKTYPIYRINKSLCIECGTCQEYCSFGAVIHI
ncbi:DUF362 domain-containing protein [Desulfallas thermosapovorans]|uniref:4Fe-4S binding protein n=1 Tax=Desulfallas thermosapovorans DSM 6562 TaxID=1121431 RepID=A0A5S4ZXA8_9FIRM|nr:4Fe-4S binding protein [Desulfallas thermosapovorans]TYO97350.1 4Fe-4S binding protein [Desulfallas thermosapovorans DSM 6562]